MTHYHKRGRSVRWSDKEIALLQEFYPTIWVKNLVHKFPNRTKETIVAKARHLNLPSAKLWQPEENAILQTHFANSQKEITENLLPKRSWTAIMAQGERLGLKRIRNRPRLKVNETYFEKWSPPMAYILGFILADGCIIRGTYKGYSDSLKFGVHIKDIDILEKIKRELNSNHSISIFKNAAHLCITSQKMVDSLKCLKISYQKSLRENVPEIPQEFIRDFIRGVVDGDGSLWIDKQKNYPTLSVSGGEKMLTFVRKHFFEEFEIYSSLTKQSYSTKIKKHLYQIAYRTNPAQALIEYLYKDAGIFLNRKYKMAQLCLKPKIKKREHIKTNTKNKIKYYETLTSGESDQGGHS